MNITEPAREIPVVGTPQVLIAGGGPAGVAAALAASRLGASATIVEAAGYLGGTWTAGSICWVIDADGKGGIGEEIGDRLGVMGVRAYRVENGRDWAYDPEKMKLLLDELSDEAGVHLRYHTQLAAAVVEGDHIDAAVTESKSGREAWQADIYIDCTGDGDLAAHAGCSFAYGHPETGKPQPMSLPFLVTGLDPKEIEPFLCGGLREPKIRLLEAIKAGGFEPSYQPPVLMRITDDLYVMIADHQYEVDSRDAGAMSDATRNARKEIDSVVQALKRNGGPWSNIRLVHSADHIGVREGRRIRGRSTIDIATVLEGFYPADSIATCSVSFDVHSPDGKKSKGFAHPTKKGKAYGISLAALISAERDNLLMGGRCISGDFYAHSGYRVTGDVVAMGQAAGTCAAIAVREGITPSEVDASVVRQAMKDAGCVVPEV